MKILDNIYGVLFKPEQTFLELNNRQYLSSSVVVILIISILSSLNLISASSNNLLSTLFIVPVVTTSFLFVWMIFSLFLSFTTDLMGGAGKITDTMIGVAYSFLPYIFLHPLYLVFYELKLEQFDLNTIIVYLWITFLMVLSLKHTHKISMPKAIISFISVFIISGAIIFASILFLIMLIILFSFKFV